MAANRDATGHKACADARAVLMQTCTNIQLEQNPQMANLAKMLGGNVAAGLAQIKSDAPEARNVASLAPDRGEVRGV